MRPWTLHSNSICEMSNFYSAMAYPGSKLYTIALEKNWELPKTWLGFSQHSKECLPLRTEHISAGEVLGFRDYAFHKYFAAPSYLHLVKQKFGQATLDHIQDMVKYRLSRDFATQYKDDIKKEIFA